MKQLGIISRPVVRCPITKENRAIKSCTHCDCFSGVDMNENIISCKADEEPYTAQMDEIKRLIYSGVI